MGWGAARRAMQWRRRGEGASTPPSPYPGQPSYYQQQSRPSLATAVLRSSVNNAIGAAIFSAGWGVHGLRYEAWKQWQWTQASGSDAWHITVGGVRALFDVACLGGVLRLAPFSLGPAVLMTLIF